MICKLCNNEKKLIKAHIIPEFLYKDMKDAKNTFYEMTYSFEDKPSKTKKVQTGVFDKNILCSDCDNNILGCYDKYAKESIYGKIKLDKAPRCDNFKNPNDGLEYTICKNIDYRLKKNFLLSMLWRSSITSQPLFENVELGAKHEERLREILLNNLEIEEDEYPILTFSFFRTTNPMKELIGQPLKQKSKDGVVSYIFIVNGIQYVFYVNSLSHRLPDYIKKGNIKKNGEYTIVHFPEGEDKEFLKNLLIN